MYTMFDRKEEKFSYTNIWLNLDFKKVKQRLKSITDQLDEVRGKFQSQSEANSADEFSKVEENCDE